MLLGYSLYLSLLHACWFLLGGPPVIQGVWCGAVLASFGTCVMCGVVVCIRWCGPGWCILTIDRVCEGGSE